MKVWRAFKYRLYPNKEQQEKLAVQFGCGRFVYNYFLRKRVDYYAVHKEDPAKKGLNVFDTMRMLTELKKQPEYAWLKNGNSQSLQQELRNLDVAYNRFFNKRTEFPNFKKKHGQQSVGIPQHFSLKDGKLIVPKISPIRVIVHRPLIGQLKSATVSRTKTGKYFVSILCEVDQPEPEYTGDDVGLDLGLKDFAILSNGEKIKSPKYLRKAEKKLKRFQRCHSRRKKGSKGREHSRQQLAKQYEKVSNKRKDFQHKLSHRLSCENQAISLEDLHVKGMLANHKLAKSISDASWSEFVRQLEYKGLWYGCKIYYVDRFFPSSKRCHECGYIKQDLTLKNRAWACPECGCMHDRDLNAALNIKLFSVRTVGATETNTLVESRVTDSRKPEAVPL